MCPAEPWREALKEKANREATEAKLTALEKDLDEFKQIALSAKAKAAEPHLCLKESELDRLTEWKEGLSKFKIGAIIATLVIIVAAIGQFYTLKGGVDKNTDTLVKVSKSQESIKDTIVNLQRTDETREQKRLVNLKIVMKEALAEHEVKADIKPKKKKR